jgi:predicted nucleic acid-binding protein
MVILDTDILIEFYKGNAVVKKEIENLRTDIFYLSSITVAEFVVVARNKEDQNKIKK